MQAPHSSPCTQQLPRCNSITTPRSCSQAALAARCSQAQPATGSRSNNSSARHVLCVLPVAEPPPGLSCGVLPPMGEAPPGAPRLVAAPQPVLQHLGVLVLGSMQVVAAHKWPHATMQTHLALHHNALHLHGRTPKHRHMHCCPQECSHHARLCCSCGWLPTKQQLSK
jgi:hypothetical protein